MITNAISIIPGTSMDASAQLAPRYEALFVVSDCLRSHQDIEGLVRVLPIQLQPVLDFNYMSVFLNKDPRNENQPRRHISMPSVTAVLSASLDAI